MILAWITVTFLIFHTPRAVLNVYEFKSYHDRETCQDFADQFAATTYRAINATDDDGGGRVAAINETLVSSGPWFREGLPPPDQLSYEGKPITFFCYFLAYALLLRKSPVSTSPVGVFLDSQVEDLLDPLR